MANYDVESHIYMVQKNVLFFYFWNPMLIRPVMKRLFFPWKNKEKRARFARAHHNNEAVFDLRAKKRLHSGSYEHRVPTIKSKTFICTRGVYLFILFNCFFV